MGKILLDYVFPISIIQPTPQASTAFLKQVCLIVKAKSGAPNNTLTLCTSSAQVAAVTDNLNGKELLNGGMNRIYVYTSSTLDIEAMIEANKGLFFTVLVSDDFVDADFSRAITTPAVKAVLNSQGMKYEAVVAGLAGNDISVEVIDGATAGNEVVTVINKNIIIQVATGVSTGAQVLAKYNANPQAVALAIMSITTPTAQAVSAAKALAAGADAVLGASGLKIGAFDGVVGVSTSNVTLAAEQAAINNRCAFYASSINKAKNMMKAFASLLSNQLNWNNQQYIQMTYNDDVNSLGDANNLFDNKVSFVLSDDEFGSRLALFACGKKAIVAPYIIKDLCINLQSKALQWIAANQPQYTLKQAALLEERLQEDVINSFIDRNRIESGSVQIALEQDNFVASGYISVPEPKALWRVVSELRQTI